MKQPAIGLAAACALACAACQSAPSGPDAGACTPYVSTADLTTPVVSFAADVMPIFRKSCAYGSECHGDFSAVSDHRPFLGFANGDGGITDDKIVADGLVGIKSGEDLLMDLVAAGDPAHSFLMHKMDDDQCTLIAQCRVGNSFRPNCGVFMPYQFPDILDMATRDTIRRWIAQGAKND